MTTTLLNKIPFSLRSFSHRVAIKCGVMKHKTLLNNSGIMETATYCDRGATKIGFVAPSRTQSHLVAPNRSNFSPLFPDHGCVPLMWDQPQQVGHHLDRGLTTTLAVKPSQTQSRSVKVSQGNFFPLFSEVFPFSIFHFPFGTSAAIREGSL
jgi:hypothetical protein